MLLRVQATDGGSMEDLTGKQFGPYQIVAPLGEGGMAVAGIHAALAASDP